MTTTNQSASITTDPASITTDLSKILSSHEELEQLLRNDDISSYDKLYSYYLNADKTILKTMEIRDIKKLIKYLCAVSYEVTLPNTYAVLLNNVLADLNKFKNTTTDHTYDVTGFTEFLNLTAMILVEQAIYNIDNNDHRFRIIEDVEDVANVSAAMQMKYDSFINAISIF
tara:strand:- start:6111 stop:6623 length:513 start_codon:yes stop_codon:yes gene_type:complete